MNGNADEYFERIYLELKRIASLRLAGKSDDETLNPTALIHEAYMKVHKVDQVFDDKHFKALAAQAMQRILIDRARKRNAAKRGAGLRNMPMVDLEQTVQHPEFVLEVHELLEAFHARSPRKAELVRLKIFGGLTTTEAAQVLEISQSTAENDWAFAVAWLRREWTSRNSEQS